MIEPTFQKLLSLAATLRSPDGCPWDRKQTIAGLQKDFLEEAEEMAAAIRKKDHENLKEELGDVLFNIVLITQIASEENLFTMPDVLNGIIKKIIDRHTWVFGKDKGKVKTAEEAIALWKKNKAKEKGKSQSSKVKSITS